MTVQHAYFCCQPGAEPALKQEVAADAAGLLLGFSRPGFVTFKLPEPATISPDPLARVVLPRPVFARTQGLSLGKIAGAGDGSTEPATLDGFARRVWSNEHVQQLGGGFSPLRLHVWQRDTQRPGEGGFEPGPTPLSREAFAAVSRAAPEGWLADRSAKAAKGRRGWTLDVILVEPDAWWLGVHAVQNKTDRWPGGVPPLTLPEHAVSRAYLKMREALAWSRMPAVRGDQWIELGAAPGGASQALLDAGMRVIGVDPAEVDPAVASASGFRALRMRAAEVKKKELASGRWLAADINAAPSYTLDAAESVVAHAGVSIRGLLLTLKLPDWSVATPDALAEYAARVRSWGFRDVRLRQLAFNRRELCLAALRSRGQRRMRRGNAKRRRHAPPASGLSKLTPGQATDPAVTPDA